MVAIPPEVNRYLEDLKIQNLCAAGGCAAFVARTPNECGYDTFHFMNRVPIDSFLDVKIATYVSIRGANFVVVSGDDTTMLPVAHHCGGPDQVESIRIAGEQLVRIYFKGDIWLHGPIQVNLRDFSAFTYTPSTRAAIGALVGVGDERAMIESPSMPKLILTTLVPAGTVPPIIFPVATNPAPRYVICKFHYAANVPNDTTRYVVRGCYGVEVQGNPDSDEDQVVAIYDTVNLPSGGNLVFQAINAGNAIIPLPYDLVFRAWGLNIPLFSQYPT